MASRFVKRCFLFLVLSVVETGIFAQDNVPLGIHYQAVARDNYGNELANRKISIKFSIIKDDPLGAVIYQELHQDLFTSKFGVFSLIIGQGVPTGSAVCGELSQINWEEAYHFLKVEVKFENDFMDMGTMQFLAVPYALFARKSLEPGPQGLQGLKGDPGDPATDDQTLSVVNINGSDYLAISGGNQVKISSIESDGDPTNELQDITISSDKLKITDNPLATEWDLSPYRQLLLWDPSTRLLSISGATSPVNLSELKDDADADPDNEIQDIELTGDNLTITNNTTSAGVLLDKYLDNTDEQQLAFKSSDNTLTLTNSDPVDLTSLKNDADADRENEIQTLTYNPENYQLSLTKDNNPVTIGEIIAFRAGIASSLSLPDNTPVDLIFNLISGDNYYNEGDDYDDLTGTFLVPYNGIYSFSVSISLPTNGSIIIEVLGTNYETIIGPTSSNGTFRGSITMKLNKDDIVNLSILQNNDYAIPSYSVNGYFSGYRIY